LSRFAWLGARRSSPGGGRITDLFRGAAAGLGAGVIGGLAGIAAYTICVFALNITETRDLPRLFARR